MSRKHFEELVSAEPSGNLLSGWEKKLSPLKHLLFLRNRLKSSPPHGRVSVKLGLIMRENVFLLSERELGAGGLQLRLSFSRGPECGPERGANAASCVLPACLRKRPPPEHSPQILCDGKRADRVVNVGADLPLQGWRWAAWSRAAKASWPGSGLGASPPH